MCVCVIERGLQNIQEIERKRARKNGKNGNEIGKEKRGRERERERGKEREREEGRESGLIGGRVLGAYSVPAELFSNVNQAIFCNTGDVIEVIIVIVL